MNTHYTIHIFQVDYQWRIERAYKRLLANLTSYSHISIEFFSSNICQAQRAHQAAKELREAVEQLSGGGLGDPKGARAFGGLCLKRFQRWKKSPGVFPIKKLGGILEKGNQNYWLFIQNSEFKDLL